MCWETSVVLVFLLLVGDWYFC